MERIRRSTNAPAAAALLLVMLVTSLGGEAAPAWTGVAHDFGRVRNAVPADEFEMAGGCYVMRAPSGGYVAPGQGSFITTASHDDAERFTFQATDLGSYLLYDTQGAFLAAIEGLPAVAAHTATKSLPGQIVGGVVLERTDQAADLIARSPANAGRGASLVAASEPSELADWAVALGSAGFSFALPATSQKLIDDKGVLGFAADGDEFGLELATGCKAYPEVEVNVDGPVVGGASWFQETRGFIDAHLHMMAFEFIGGRVRCGRPWHRFGVTHALVDCADHHPGGQGAVLEQVLSGPGPHDVSGWPTFTGWPRYNSLTHEQIYYKWMERAWRGGLRLFTNLLVDNGQLCNVYPFKRNSCNEMDGVRLQALRIRQLERYIDAQSGGPGKGWFRIVTDPFEARRVINSGKLAVVLGIEVSVPLDCGMTRDIPRCDPAQVEQRLDEVYALGVRQMELVNKFDNAFSGVTGDAGNTGIVVNQGNLGETGSYWRMDTCGQEDGDAHDRQQINAHDHSPAPKDHVDRDSLAGTILSTFGRSGVVPLYPQGPHCNQLGLSELGRKMIQGMISRGMIFDPDHMSARARTQAMDLIEETGYSGVVSSHSWSDDTIYPRVLKAGGVVTPYAGGAAGFVNAWRKHKGWRDDRFYFGFGYGADTNGFGSQGGPRGANVANKVTYPFSGFGGVTVHAQVSGTRTYNVNSDGVAHYGLYPDWLQDLRNIAGDDGDELWEDMTRGTEAFLQMWERATGIPGDACRADVDDLTDDDVSAVVDGTDVEGLVRALGQPSTRGVDRFTFCMTGGRTATAHLTEEGKVSVIDVG